MSYIDHRRPKEAFQSMHVGKSLFLAIVRILMKPATDNAGNPVSSSGSIRPMAAPGHYDKCRFMFSALAASEIWPGFDAFNSLASFA